MTTDNTYFLLFSTILLPLSSLPLLLQAMWDDGRGSHHPDYDPEAIGEDVVKVEAVITVTMIIAVFIVVNRNSYHYHYHYHFCRQIVRQRSF